MTRSNHGRIRVLHVIQNLNYGGMERLLADIVLRADPNRFEMHVLCLQYLGRFADGLAERATLHVANQMSHLSMLVPRRLALQIREIAPDVVHSHSGVWYKAALAARMAGVPRLIHTDHGRSRPDPLIHRVLDGIAARRSDAVIAVSQRLKHELHRALRVDQARVHLIVNGVDTERFRPRADLPSVAEEIGLPDGAPVIGSVGRLEPVKGYDVMLEAFALLRQELTWDTPPVLVLAGEGSQRASLETRARSLGLQDAVRITGWRDDIHALHATFTLFTLASHSEGTSVSLLEAMSAGLCPIVTDVGGNADVLGHEFQHRLVAPADPRALADAWLRALRDGAERRRDGDRARERVRTQFGLEAMVRKYERIYEGG